jgi:hypothetical protein
MGRLSRFAVALRITSFWAYRTFAIADLDGELPPPAEFRFSGRSRSVTSAAREFVGTTPPKEFRGHLTLNISNDGFVYAAERIVTTKDGKFVKEFISSNTGPRRSQRSRATTRMPRCAHDPVSLVTLTRQELRAQKNKLWRVSVTKDTKTTRPNRFS